MHSLDNLTIFSFVFPNHSYMKKADLKVRDRHIFRGCFPNLQHLHVQAAGFQSNVLLRCQMKTLSSKPPCQVFTHHQTGIKLNYRKENCFSEGHCISLVIISAEDQMFNKQQPRDCSQNSSNDATGEWKAQQNRPTTCCMKQEVPGRRDAADLASRLSL